MPETWRSPIFPKERKQRPYEPTPVDVLEVVLTHLHACLDRAGWAMVGRGKLKGTFETEVVRFWYEVYDIRPALRQLHKDLTFFFTDERDLIIESGRRLVTESPLAAVGARKHEQSVIRHWRKEIEKLHHCIEEHERQIKLYELLIELYEETAEAERKERLKQSREGRRARIAGATNGGGSRRKAPARKAKASPKAKADAKGKASRKASKPGREHEGYLRALVSEEAPLRERTPGDQ